MGLASRGLRDMGGGPERIQDEAELAAVRARARRVLRDSLIATILLTGATLLVP